MTAGSVSADPAASAISQAGTAAEYTAAAKLALAEQRSALTDSLAKGVAIETLIGRYRECLDVLVSKAWSLSLGDTGALALVATGGYGRGELYPHSDIDLLVCGEEAEHARHAEAIGRFFSMLWDSGLKVGQAVRSIAHCLEQSRLDVATYTSLLEIRLLAGNNTVFLELDAAVNSPEVYDARGYFEAKRDEQRQRHAKFHNTADNLEPNLKEGPGGLRDFHTLNWLSRKLYGVSSLAGLVPLGLLGEAEWQALLRNWRIVARLRFALHLVVKRPEERLLFDHQKSLAELFGLKDTPDNLAVEQLMQDFFRSAAILLRINDRLLQRFEEHLAEEQVVTAIDDHFELKNGYLLARDNRFGPESLPRLFDLFAVWSGLAGCKGLHSDTARGLAESLPDILPYDEQPESTRAAFIALISHPQGVLSLQRLARLGILARYLPEFGQVTGRMQYDLFHVYTVDQHTLNVLEFIRRFEQGRVDGFSLPHEVFPRLRKPHLIWLAGLFHDIAKGRGGDHAELGAADFARFARSHGLPAADAQLVEWLIAQHLLMSFTAQKFDISDPDIINGFAGKVADREHLDYLYVLTCADIAGTSPKLWNAFKDQLMADLYTATRYVLRVGLEHPLNAEDIRAETRNMALAKLMDAGFSESDVQPLWETYPEDAFLRYRPDQLVWQTQGVLSQAAMPSQILVRELVGKDSLEIFVRTPDRDGIISGLLATLDRLNLSVFHARILSSNDGYALDNFITLKGSHTPDSKRIAQTLSAALKDPASIKPAKHLLPSRLRHFKTPTRIEFSSAAGDRTLMSLVCADRPGLLADIGYVLLQRKVRVHDARIATFGERAEDIFVLSDRDNHALSDPAVLHDLQAALLDYLEGRKP
ncbi:[protein-PII] uridylyltransferase [Arenimonas sp.]|uniref:[protein-PII] uridylyltransferase n=1 Tax=Arenimonas sp. TaxID=1872635 RepID=UPI0037BF36EB